MKVFVSRLCYTNYRITDIDRFDFCLLFVGRIIPKCMRVVYPNDCILLHLHYIATYWSKGESWTWCSWTELQPDIASPTREWWIIHTIPTCLLFMGRSISICMSIVYPSDCIVLTTWQLKDQDQMG